jgi:hypothetical protein
MFTRVVEITTKTGKSHELANTIHEKVYRFSGCEGDKAAKNFIRVSARVAWRAATCAISRAMRPASSASLSAAMIIPRETFEKHACADSPRHDR